EGSLTGAARRCHVTPSALTLAIDELERHLGLRLLVRRKGRGVTVTSAGSRVLAQARDVLGRAEALTEDAAAMPSGIAGQLSLGAFTTLTPFFIPAIIDAFRRDHPEVELDLTTAAADELCALLTQGSIDMALMYRVDVPDELWFDPVLQYRPHVLLA